jgi:hypothetical protein
LQNTGLESTLLASWNRSDVLLKTAFWREEEHGNHKKRYQDGRKPLTNQGKRKAAKCSKPIFSFLAGGVESEDVITR